MKFSLKHINGADFRKVPAIKALRYMTGLGLKEAKETIESVADGIPMTVFRDPQRSNVEFDSYLFDLNDAGVITDISERGQINALLKEAATLSIKQDNMLQAIAILNIMT